MCNRTNFNGNRFLFENGMTCAREFEGEKRSLSWNFQWINAIFLRKRMSCQKKIKLVLKSKLLDAGKTIWLVCWTERVFWLLAFGLACEMKWNQRNNIHVYWLGSVRIDAMIYSRQNSLDSDVSFSPSLANRFTPPSNLPRQSLNQKWYFNINGIFRSYTRTRTLYRITQGNQFMKHFFSSIPIPMPFTIKHNAKHFINRVSYIQVCMYIVYTHTYKPSRSYLLQFNWNNHHNAKTIP